MAKRVVKGRAFNVAPGIVYFKGKNPNKTDDIDIGPNNSKGLSVNNGEFGEGFIASANGKKVTPISNNVRILSNEPMFNGKSPAQLFHRGMPFDTLFTMQEQYKDINRINDDGSHYKKGGKRNTPVKEINRTSAQRDSAQVNIFKPGDNSRIQINRAKHRASLENFVKNNPTLYGLNTSDFVDFLLDNATMESENSSTASHGSMYGYYQLKGLNKKSTEDQQHRAAFKHLANLFNNVLTDADIRKANELGISQAQLLHKTWNQERKVLNYLYQGKDNSDGLGTKISNWGNNNSLEIDYSPYVMRATNDNNIIIKQGDTPEGILKAYRGAGLKERTFNDHAKDFQTIFGKSPNNLQINDVLTNAYLIGPRKSDGTFKYGGSLINQSLGERPNAKFGKEMSKNKVLKYPKQEVSDKRKKAVYGREVDPFMGYGKKLPDMPFTLTRGANGYLTPQFKPIEVPKLDIGPKPAFREVDPFMGTRKLGVNSVPVSGNNSGSGGISGGGGGMSAGKMDLIGAGIQMAGNLAAAGINQIAINNMKVTPHQYTLLNPVKLKTKVNIAPQVAEMRDTVAKLTDMARKTSASSRTMYQKSTDARRYGAQQIMSLLGEKENKETALINQDRLNQQTVAEKNANRIMDTINGNADRRVQLENEKSRLTANNWVGAINNTGVIIDGPQGVFAREEARRSQAANLAMMSMAYPDAARLMQGDRWTHAFDGYYDMLNSRGGHGNGWRI